MTESSPPAPSAPAPINRRLLGLNFALLMVLGVVTILVIAQPGGAQPGGTVAQPTGQRARGDYTVVSGRYQGGTSNAVYILDAANQELLALSWNRSKDEIEIIGHRRLMDDGQFKQGR